MKGSWSIIYADDSHTLLLYAYEKLSRKVYHYIFVIFFYKLLNCIELRLWNYTRTRPYQQSTIFT